ncbi:predicted protein [Histoplasma capsulatum var. duboisii H88]|uniref:Predicted protein n=1 Tax=Ajellomyces capsulatus (strain H88) TaxID=544711 RepID=F0UG99_AJEC8|nr:predicted protein [Histoplasma capsulatum var. duboisii H88]
MSHIKDLVASYYLTLAMSHYMKLSNALINLSTASLVAVLAIIITPAMANIERPLFEDQNITNLVGPSATDNINRVWLCLSVPFTPGPGGYGKYFEIAICTVLLIRVNPLSIFHQGLVFLSQWAPELRKIQSFKCRTGEIWHTPAMQEAIIPGSGRIIVFCSKAV